MGRVVSVGCVIWRVLQICRDVNEHLGELVRVWGSCRSLRMKIFDTCTGDLRCFLCVAMSITLSRRLVADTGWGRGPCLFTSGVKRARDLCFVRRG